MKYLGDFEKSLIYSIITY